MPTNRRPAPAKLLPAYLLVGEDQLKRETAIRRLKARLDEGLAAFNLDERAASADLDPTNIAISLNTLPMGTGFRLVLLHDADRLPQAVKETIISYLANPNPSCVLCLDADKLAKNTRLYKAIAKVGARSVIDCSPVKARDLPAYVVKHAAAKGVSIDQRAAAELVSRVGANTTLLDRQIQTLGELCAGGVIGVADVEANVARTAEVKPWEFLDCVSTGDARRSLELLRHMDTSPLALLTLITRRVRELICARALIDRGQARKVASELGRQEWQVRTLMQAARRFDPTQLVSCLEACATCERALKSGAEGETALVSLVAFICNPR